MSEARLPVVAVIGAPNAGKSTLVNRILRRRQAVVAEEPGTTRDHSYSRAEWAGWEFSLVDTGGMEPGSAEGLTALVTLQARAAALEADVVIHLADGRTGPTEADDRISRELRRARGTTVLAVNKLDNPADDAERYQFYALGEGEPHAVSALHGTGTGDLLDAVVSRLPEIEEEGEYTLPRLAIVGRPNVGKSTLLNRLLDAERAVVSAEAGTTTDAVAAEVSSEGSGGESRFLLLDTAGVSRRTRRAGGVPYYSALRSEGAIRRAEVSLLVVDAVDGLVAGDLHLAGKVEEAGGALGVVANKADLAPPGALEELEGSLTARMTDLKPPALALSALTGKGVEEVMPLAARLHEAYHTSVPTHEAAEFINRLTGRSPPPGGVRMRYALQSRSAPPEFTVFANRPRDIPESYERYLENSLRERYHLWGVSLRIRFKSSR